MKFPAVQLGQHLPIQLGQHGMSYVRLTSSAHQQTDLAVRFSKNVTVILRGLVVTMILCSSSLWCAHFVRIMSNLVYDPNPSNQ